MTEGMVLGKPVYNDNGNVLLREGVVLTMGYISKIVEMDVSGLYIDDVFSKKIEVKDVISEELRSNSVKAARHLLLETGNGKNYQKSMEEVDKCIEKIMDEILSTDSAVINMINVKSHDLYTYQHSVNVCVLSCIIGLACEMSRAQLKKLATSALLHDIGKVFIDKAILNKPGKLSQDEWETIKTHPELGSECAGKKYRFPTAICRSILMHHERYDGTGYPSGTGGEDIPIFARIIAISDVYDAITSRRPYHEAVSPAEAYEYIMGNSGRHFSPHIVDIFTRKVAPFPEGLSVKLSNGMKGIVFKNYEDCLTRPVIKLYPEPGHPEDRFLDLKNDPCALDITVLELLS